MNGKYKYIWVDIIFGITAMLLTGFAIMNLWSWFIVPLGVISISFIHALSIDILITLIVATSVTEPKDLEEKIFRLTYANVAPLLSLLTGFIFKSYI